MRDRCPCDNFYILALLVFLVNIFLLLLPSFFLTFVYSPWELPYNIMVPDDRQGYFSSFFIFLQLPDCQIKCDKLALLLFCSNMQDSCELAMGQSHVKGLSAAPLDMGLSHRYNYRACCLYLNTSSALLYPNFGRGRLFNTSTYSLSWLFETSWMDFPFGINSRSNPLKFSLVPRSYEA